MSTLNKFAIIVLSIFLFFSSLWMIDVSVIAMKLGHETVSLFGTWNPVDSYHLGLVTISALFIGMIIWLSFVDLID